MNNLPPDDEKLVEFLRQYRPVPPPASPDAEERLLAAIDSEPQIWQSRYSFRWAIPALVAAGVLFVWGGIRLFTPLTLPQGQVADRNRDATDTADIEEFMFSSWNGAIDGATPIAYNETSESNWTLLNELDSNSDFSNDR
jgi:hypothetical protein